MATPDPACPDYPNECVHPWAHARTHAEVKATQDGPNAVDLADVSTEALAAELTRRNVLPRCTCRRWRTYLGAYDRDGYTLRCRGCLRAIARCTCR